MCGMGGGVGVGGEWGVPRDHHSTTCEWCRRATRATAHLNCTVTSQVRLHVGVAGRTLFQLLVLGVRSILLAVVRHQLGAHPRTADQRWLRTCWTPKERGLVSGIPGSEHACSSCLQATGLARVPAAPCIRAARRAPARRQTCRACERRHWGACSSGVNERELGCISYGDAQAQAELLPLEAGSRPVEADGCPANPCSPEEGGVVICWH